jgi:glutathione S-transferase
MVRIIGRDTSINVRKVLWLCEEIDLDHHRVDPDASLADLNPNALSPVLLDGELVLWESNTILRYLAEAYDTSSLYPTDVAERAKINQWIDWQATEFNTSWRYAFMALVRQNPAFTDSAEIAASMTAWANHVRILDQQLARTGGHVARKEFTLADIPMGLSVNRWMKTPGEKEPFAHVEAYYHRLSERPAFQRLARDGAP